MGKVKQHQRLIIVSLIILAVSWDFRVAQNHWRSLEISSSGTSSDEYLCHFWNWKHNFHKIPILECSQLQAMLKLIRNVYNSVLHKCKYPSNANLIKYIYWIIWPNLTTWSILPNPITPPKCSAKSTNKLRHTKTSIIIQRYASVSVSQPITII